MNKTIQDTKKGRGRPKSEDGPGTQIGTRWRDTDLAEIDEWRRAEPDIPGRAEAIRRLVKLGLVSVTKSRK
jgi:hypothetical protein